MLLMNNSTEHPSGVAETYKQEASDRSDWTQGGLGFGIIWKDLRCDMDCAIWRTPCIHKWHQVVYSPEWHGQQLFDTLCTCGGELR